MLFFGMAMKHLWFLPFILICSLLAFPVLRTMLRDRQLAGIISLAAALVGIAICFVNSQIDLPLEKGLRHDLSYLWILAKWLCHRFFGALP